jgi:hypothetical protein
MTTPWVVAGSSSHVSHYIAIFRGGFEYPAIRRAHDGETSWSCSGSVCAGSRAVKRPRTRAFRQEVHLSAVSDDYPTTR